MKKALLIGINYPGKPAQLKGCVDDVNNIQNFLVRNCNYQQQNITKLTDSNATTEMIKSQINNLISGCNAGDTLFFYYSGHGAQVTGSCSAEKKQEDDAIIPNNYDTSGYITDDWLYVNLASKIPANVTLWAFTDCCHSGTMLDLKYNWIYTPQLLPGISETNITQYNESHWANNFNVSLINSIETQGHVFLFSGCGDVQTSADAYENNEYQGAFSYCLLEFVNHNGNKFNTLPIAYVLKEINCHLFIKNYQQRSQLSIGKSSDFNVIFNP
jgi:hypothetical protein